MREIATEEAEQFAKEEGLLFLEASAKTGYNVDEAFDHAARNILKKIQAGVFDERKVSGVEKTTTCLPYSPHILIGSWPKTGTSKCSQPTCFRGTGEVKVLLLLTLFASLLTLFLHLFGLSPWLKEHRSDVLIPSCTIILRRSVEPRREVGSPDLEFTWRDRFVTDVTQHPVCQLGNLRCSHHSASPHLRS